MKPLAFLFLLAGCSTPMALEDAGVDAGVDAGAVDAGPECFDVPPRFQATCGSLDFYRTYACKPTAAETVQAHLGLCDAGYFLTRGECGASLESARWQYGPIGDTYECFYARDGGALVGAINFSDHGTLAAGTVGDCAATSVNVCP